MMADAMATAEQHPSGELLPELEDYRQRFEAAKHEFRSMVADIDDDQFNWRPGEEEWSVAECFDHLVMIGDLMLVKLDEGIERAAEADLRSNGPYRYGALGNWFVRAVGPAREGKKRKFRAPKLYTPTSRHTISRLDKAFTELQDALIERLRRANGYDLGRVKVPSPVTRLLRLSLGQWFALLAGHQERHIDQAREAKARMPSQAA